MEENKVTNEEIKETVEKTETVSANTAYKYKINPEFTGFALERYFKNYVYKRNWCYTAVFAFILVLYVIEIVREPKNVVFWLLGGLCLALILWLWFKVTTFKSKTISAAEITKDDVYECDLFDDYMRIKIVDMVVNDETGERVEDAEPTKINFKTDYVLVEEYEKMFILFVEREMTFIISKEEMDEKTLGEFKNFFKNYCGENYIAAKAE